MKKLRYTIFLFTMLLLVTGFGCKGLSEEEKSSIKPITLEYWTVFNDVATLQQFADEYKQLRPYVTINIRQVRYAEFDNLFTNALADDIGPDIISSHVHWLRQYESRLSSMPGTVQVADVEISGGQFSQEVKVTPVTVAMPSARGIETNFVRTVRDDIFIRGRIYGLPIALDTLGLYYNKVILDQAGIPEPPKTWAEFLDVVEQITRISGSGEIIQSAVALGTGNNIDNASDIFALLLMQNGVDVVKDGTVAFAGGLDQATSGHPTLEALRFYTDFARPTKEVYSWNARQRNAFNTFTEGRSAFYFGFAFDGVRIRGRSPQLDVEVIPVPQLNDANPVNVANYWVESVVKKSTHQDEAWDFIRFMTTPDKIKQYTDVTGQPSPLRSHVSEQQENPQLAAFATGILTAKNWYTGRNIQRADDAITGLMTRYLLPYTEDMGPLERDVKLIVDAATIIQQTL